ncbi:SAM-dependent methyltransferase [Nonomuraea sp. NPDC000554]|uniref:SAM-dependent methyltransferase n=1 Tax=Nonomuraea sp. NPDC000554 TaxID=3154259 RepID=UPI00332B5293
MDQEPLGFDPTTPNVARLYDYYLGGKDHFPADREAAERLLRVAPEVRAAARANRAFLGRAVRFLADSGITQFLDIGTGLPTQGNVHEVARAVAPESRVVYVDRDPVVLVHARALLAGDEPTRVVQGDLRRPEEILKNPDLLDLIDFTKPVGVLLVAIMHFISKSDDPQRIVATLREAMAPGSFLVMSHGTSDARADAVRKSTEVYRTSTSPLSLRSRQQVEELFEGFDLVDPGVVWLPEWRPDQADTIDFVNGPESSLILCGVAGKS